MGSTVPQTADLKPLGKTDCMVPAIGMGTWGIGGCGYTDVSRGKEAIAALQAGIELGMWLIDTAELYGRGHCEERPFRHVYRSPLLRSLMKGSYA